MLFSLPAIQLPYSRRSKADDPFLSNMVIQLIGSVQSKRTPKVFGSAKRGYFSVRTTLPALSISIHLPSFITRALPSSKDLANM